MQRFAYNLLRQQSKITRLASHAASFTQFSQQHRSISQVTGWKHIVSSNLVKLFSGPSCHPCKSQNLQVKSHVPLSYPAILSASATTSLQSQHFGESPLAAVLPVDLAEQFLIALHNTTGLPWWVSLSAGALCFRLLVAPATLHQLKTSAKYSRLSHIIAHSLRLFMSIPKLPKPHFRQHTYLEALQATKAAYAVFVEKLPKVRAIGLFLPMAIAIPTFMTFNLACRRILSSDLPGLATEGPMWCPDLTAADPTHFFPILALAATVVNLHYLFTRFVDVATPPTSSNSGNGLKSPADTDGPTKSGTKAFANTLCFGLQGLAVAVTPFLLHMPAGMFLYWIIAMTVSTLQNRALRAGFVRQWAGFNQPPFPVITQSPVNPLLGYTESPGMLLLPPVMSVDKAYRLERLETLRKRQLQGASSSSTSSSSSSSSGNSLKSGGQVSEQESQHAHTH